MKELFDLSPELPLSPKLQLQSARHELDVELVKARKWAALEEDEEEVLLALEPPLSIRKLRGDWEYYPGLRDLKEKIGRLAAIEKRFA